jgi:hypothetical protein
MTVRWIILACIFIASSRSAQQIDPSKLPPLPPSPLQQFRSWLNLSEAEQEKALAAWPEEKRAILREKLRAYGSLPAEQRDRRLNMLDLRWHLRPLMRMPVEQRAQYLQNVPPPIQPMIHERLRAWDQLDPTTRAKLIENEETQELVLVYFAQIRRGVSQDQIFASLDEPKRTRLRRALENWGRAAPYERQRTSAQLISFFELTPAEQSKTLAALSPSEQAEIQRTLDAFAKLPPEQRRACVNSFQKLASMSSEDRLHFLRNAARWSAMTPQERKTWKNLVEHLPPMPPERETLPPLPAGARNPENLATNTPH